jgi:hypothetical protein
MLELGEGVFNGLRSGESLARTISLELTERTRRRIILLYGCRDWLMTIFARTQCRQQGLLDMDLEASRRQIGPSRSQGASMRPQQRSHEGRGLPMAALDLQQHLVEVHSIDR